MRLLDEKSMLAALTEFIDKDEVYALTTMVEAQIEQSQVKFIILKEKFFFFLILSMILILIEISPRYGTK